MTVMYFGGIKYLVEQIENDRNGITIVNIVTPDSSSRLVATKDIKENYWLLSNGQRFEEGETWIKEEI